MEENSLNYHAILNILANLFKVGKINYTQFHEQYEKLLDTARTIRCEEEKTKQKQEETKQIISNDQTKQLVSNNQTKQSIKQEDTKCFISVEESKQIDIKEYSKMNSIWADTLSPLVEAGSNFISHF